MTSDGRLIIRDEDEDVKDKGRSDPLATHKLFYVRTVGDNNLVLFTDGNEINDILEEAGVKSVRLHKNQQVCKWFNVVVFMVHPLTTLAEKVTEEEV